MKTKEEILIRFNVVLDRLQQDKPMLLATIYKSMDEYAKERAILFVKFVNTQPLWNDPETNLNTIYEKFILEWGLSTQKE